MRVLHTLWSAQFGGIQRFAIDLAATQASMGMEPAFLFGRLDGEFASDFRAVGIPVFTADLISGWVTSRGTRNRVAELMRKYDVINLHTFNPLICGAAVHSGRPLVFTDHGNYGLGRVWTWRDRVKRFLQSRFTRHVDHFTFNSEYTRALASGSFRMDPSICTVVPNGIVHKIPTLDASSMPAALRSRITGSFVVGTSCRLAGVKRVHLLIEAFAAFQIGRRDVVLLIVGDGVQREDLEVRAGALGIDDRVIFAGYQREVGTYQSAMDVCVFPSIGESFGLVAIEALALGKPTLVMSDGGGMADIVRNIEPDNVVDGVAELTTRLRQLCAQQEADRRDSGVGLRAARIAYAKTFDIRSTSSAMKRIYDSVLDA